MKQKLKLLPALIALLAGMPTAAQNSETPIITFKTTLYDNAGADNAFHFYVGASQNTYLDIDFGFGKTEVEVEQATFDTSTSSIKATTVTGSVSEAGTVKIYGDASLIDYLDLEGVYITDLDISALTNLEILNVNHNELKALDLTPFSKLQALYLTDNPFNVKPVIIGGNKPQLTILEMSIVGALDQSFNLSDYPMMASFDAYGTYDLRRLDPTGCPDLLRLSMDCTSVESLDLSKNPNLLILNISETPITEIDLSANTSLVEFYCSHAGARMDRYKIKSLDLTMLPKLQRLMCQNNALATLDVSKNPLLTDLYCNGNELTTIDVSNNPNLLNLNISNNRMDFTTMPLPRETFLEYLYYQQKFPVQRSYPVGAELDFASRVIRPDSETWFALFAVQNDADGNLVNVELDPDCYTFENGKVTLLQSQPDSLFMAFANSLFPAYDLQTTQFMVKSVEDYGKDNLAVSFRTRPAVKKIALSVGLQGATPENPKKFSVDFGDGNPVEFTTTSNVIPAEPNASGNVLKTSLAIYTPEGEDISALAIDGYGLISIDLDAAPCITDLSLTGCQLSSISLPWNRMLTNLDLSNNNLTAIDLTEADARNTKNNLRTIRIANNKLASFEPSFFQATTVDLSNNQLTEINLLKANAVVDLNLSNNLLGEVDLRDLEVIERLDLSGNELKELAIPDYVIPSELNLSMNRFPLSTLPQVATGSYTYAPQKPWSLPAKAPTVNLSSQLLDGRTTFSWFKADGTPITGDGIKQNVPGVFQLLDTSLGQIYCTFTNPAFPALSGADVYRTTDVEVAEMPTIVVCSFRTLADGIGELIMTGKEANISVYIDWEGNGSLDQFVTGTTRTEFPVSVHSGADVKVYSYEAECGLTVFSLAAGPLEFIDASPLTELTHFTVNGSKLDSDKITLPNASALNELVINNGALTSIDFIKGRYPNLRMVNFSGNKLEKIDLTEWKSLKSVHVNNNELTEAKLDNPLIWDLGLCYNNLAEIDLSGLPALDQLNIFQNELHSIDFSANPLLRIVDISYNRFDFNTLPEPRETFDAYRYGNQLPIVAEVKDDHIVDLSNYGASTFRWFIDSPYVDENGELSGEELILDKEYTLTDGVTTFLKNFTHIMCVMQNPAFPSLYLYTDFLDVRVADSAIEEISADASAGVIYDLQGRRVTNPGRGIYIVNGRKVLFR